MHKNTHSLVCTVALSHLSHRTNIFPEKQFDEGFAVLGSEREEPIHNKLGKSHQLLSDKGEKEVER